MFRGIIERTSLNGSRLCDVHFFLLLGFVVGRFLAKEIRIYLRARRFDGDSIGARLSFEVAARRCGLLGQRVYFFARWRRD